MEPTSIVKKGAIIDSQLVDEKIINNNPIRITISRLLLNKKLVDTFTDIESFSFDEYTAGNESLEDLCDGKRALVSEDS